MIDVNWCPGCGDEVTDGAPLCVDCAHVASPPRARRGRKGPVMATHAPPLPRRARAAPVDLRAMVEKSRRQSELETMTAKQRLSVRDIVAGRARLLASFVGDMADAGATDEEVAARFERLERIFEVCVGQSPAVFARTRFLQVLEAVHRTRARRSRGKAYLIRAQDVVAVRVAMTPTHRELAALLSDEQIEDALVAWVSTSRGKLGKWHQIAGILSRAWHPIVPAVSNASLEQIWHKHGAPVGKAE